MASGELLTSFLSSLLLTDFFCSFLWFKNSVETFYIVWFSSPWHKPGLTWREITSIEKRAPQDGPQTGLPGNALTKDWCGRIQNVGTVHPWEGSPGVCRKAGWTSHVERASQQHFSITSASVAVSLSSYPDSLQWSALIWKCKMKWMTSLLPRVHSSRGLIAAREPLTKSAAHDLPQILAVLPPIRKLWFFSLISKVTKPIRISSDCKSKAKCYVSLVGKQQTKIRRVLSLRSQW